MSLKWSRWVGHNNIESKEFICGFCGNKVGSAYGYFYEGSPDVRIYICTNCGYPSFFYGSEQYPGPMLGREVKNLPDDIKKVYFEMRESIKNNCFTSAVLLGRKLIMHLAVDVAKAKEGDSFVNYVEHLKKSNYIPPSGDRWLDYMKKLGNEKNHEIKIGTYDEAEKILKFVELLLIFIYEFPSEFGQQENKQETEELSKQ